MTQTLPPTAPLGGTTPAMATAGATGTLQEALRRARCDEAERAGSRSELRAARLGRLELLQDALQPLLAQIPTNVDMFDIALVPSSDPRLFIDMIGFVEVGRDTRRYLLQQDTRHGRVRIAETTSLELMVDAVTDYVARRLLERDKALASDARARSGSPGSAPTPRTVHAYRDESRAAAALHWALVAFAFLIDLLGALALFVVLGATGWYVWTHGHPPA